MAIATRSDLLTAVMIWLRRPGDTLISDTDKGNWLSLAEGRIFYGAGPPYASPPVRVRGMLAYRQFPLAAELTGGTSAGGANAQTSTHASFALSYGASITIPSGVSNTDSMTLNVNATGAKTVKKGHQRENLAANDWISGVTYNVWYDGTNYVLGPMHGAIPLPTDFLEMRRVWIPGQRPLDFKNPPEWYSNHLGATAAMPREYAVDGDHLLVGPGPDAAYGLHALYWRRFASLTADADTNWLLTNYSSIYLYAMLLESAPFIGHDERIATWHQLYASAAGGASVQDEASRRADTREPTSDDQIVNKVKR